MLILLLFALLPMSESLSSDDYRKMTKSVAKQHNLSVLYLTPMTGMFMSTCEGCRAAGQIVADIINARQDILPNYHINLDFEDENLGIYAVDRLLQFNRILQVQTNVMAAPIVIGPSVSTGCKAAEPVLRQFHQIAISIFCTAPYLADHSLYPHLYLSVSTQRTTNLAILKLIRDVGQWNRFAIITNSENSNDYQGAYYLYETAIQLGHNIPWYTKVLAVDESTIASLKESDVRVIVISMSFDYLLYQMFCEAYKQGLRGPRYTFIGVVDALTDPRELPDKFYPGCTKTMIYEQFRQAFFVGPSLQPLPVEIKKKSFLGYTGPEFDEMMEMATNHTKPTDDLMRFTCHDATLKALISLHFAEERLAPMNMSLRNFADHPEIVVKSANDSVLQNSVAGLRTAGNITYSEHGHLQNDVFMVVQWNADDGMQLVLRIDQKPNTSAFDISSYQHRFLGPIRNNWTRPRDQKILVQINSKVSDGTFITALAMSIMLVVCQLGSLAYTIYVKYKVINDPASFYLSKIMGFSGCILINISSVLFTVPNVRQDIVVPRIVLLVIGISLVNSVLTARSFLLARHILNIARATDIEGSGMISQLVAVPTTIRRQSSGSLNAIKEQAGIGRLQMSEVPPIIPSMPPEYWTSLDRKTVSSSFAFLLVNVVILTCWMTISPISCRNELTSAPFYNEATDSVTEIWVTKCETTSMQEWELAIILLHIALLTIGACMAYELGNVTADFPELGFVRAGVTNASTLLLAGFLIVAILGNPVSQDIVIAFVSLAMSCLTAMTWFYPMLHSEPVHEGPADQAEMH